MRRSLAPLFPTGNPLPVLANGYSEDTHQKAVSDSVAQIKGSLLALLPCAPAPGLDFSLPVQYTHYRRALFFLIFRQAPLEKGRFLVQVIVAMSAVDC
jgi:hypothetical protein